jgi:hypothetical protein
MSSVCGACGCPASRGCFLCGTAVCAEHAERPAAWDTPLCGECAHFVKELRSDRQPA